MMIPFNKPYLTGKEMHYMYEAVYSGKISGNGTFTKRCQSYFEERFGMKKCLLTTSCTDALEMAALLCNIQPGDEVIMPSYTFVSTANAFILRGAKIIFVDSRADHPGMDESLIEGLITEKTRIIVPVHYAGVACDMEMIMDIANKYGLYVVEDAAQAIDSYFTFRDGSKKALGAIGHLSAFSFHETKNIISGEGGLLVINDETMQARAEIIWEKGTNRSAFFRGEIDKYGWVDVGSSFLPSELNAAYLYAQLENMEAIQSKRIEIWNRYFEALAPIAMAKGFRLSTVPDFATNNGHMFYVVMDNEYLRQTFIEHLKANKIHAVFHYISLHSSQYYADKHDGRNLPYCDYYSDALVRLPMFYELDPSPVIDAIINY